ncbi:MAG: FCD domain-containing protein [Propionicimonas sp.]
MGISQIVEGLLQVSSEDPADPGVRWLPPERELGTALQMSRGMLREQLSLLEVMGVLTRVQGRGTCLNPPDTDFMATYFTVMRQLGFLTDEQFKIARQQLEVGIAAQAAATATEADIARLHTLVDEMCRCTAAEDHVGAFEADLAFHRYLARSVNNPIFNLFFEGLQHVLHDAIWQRRSLALRHEGFDAEHRRNTDTVHYAIVEAIAAGSPDLARTAMVKHFSDWELLQGLQEERDSRRVIETATAS